MRKIRLNPFTYLDYRILLNDDFIKRVSQNPSYSLRAYARDLNVSPALISDVLNGKKHFSKKSSLMIFSRLGYQATEVDYIVNLVELKIVKNPITKQLIEEKIFKKYQAQYLKHRDNAELLIKSIHHFLTYGIVFKVSDYKIVLNTLELFGFSRSSSEQVIDEFVKNKFMTLVQGKLELTDESTTMTNHEYLANHFLRYSQFIGERIEKTGIQPPFSVPHGFVMMATEKEHELITEALKQYIKTINRISQKSRGSTDSHPDRIVLIHDALFVKKLLPSEN